MTLAKRVRLLKVFLILFNIGELLVILLDLLTNVRLLHVLLVNGTQLVFFNFLIVSSLRRFKSEENR